MLRLKSLINVLMVMTILFCCHSIDPSTVYAFNYPNGNENVIVDQCPRGDSGQSGGDVSTITDDHIYSENWNNAPELDPSIPEEIAPDSSITLTVSGGCAPYTWSVSGTGFTLETEGVPTGPTNTLYADGSACGAATITVIGCDGTQVAGYVRGTVGSWGDFVQICTSDGSCWLGGPGGCSAVVKGIYKYYTACQASWIPGNNCNEEASDFPCGSVAACEAKGGYIFSACYQIWECP